MKKNLKPLFNEKDAWGDTITCVNIDSYRKVTETKLSNKQKVKRIKYAMENFDISDEDRKIFNKILGDHQVLDNVIFVSDNSYRRNSITFDPFSADQRSGQKYGHFLFTSYDLYDKNKYRNYRMPSKEIINYIKNNYESIFLFMPDYNTQKRHITKVNYNNIETFWKEY